VGPGRRFTFVSTCVASLVLLVAAASAPGSGAVRAAPPVDVVTVSSDGPLTMNGPSWKVLKTLTISAKGKYVLWAKAYFQSTQASQHVTCRLVAGSNDDESKTAFSEGTNGYGTVVLHVVHTFKAAGKATIRCSASKGRIDAREYRLTAVRVASITVAPTATVVGAAPAGTNPDTDTYTFSRYRDGPVEVKNPGTDIISMTLSTGNYVVWAKAYFQPTASSWKQSTFCELFTPAGITDYYHDESAVSFAKNHADSLATHLVISLSQPRTVYFRCRNMYDGPPKANFIKLTAMKVGAVLNNAHNYPAPVQQHVPDMPPADVYSAYDDGPVAVAKTSWSPVVKLWIPKAGSYFLSAKAYLKSDFGNRPTTCMLKAGSVDDESKVWLDDQANHSATLFTVVAYTFKKPNWATFSCKVQQPSSKPVQAYWAKLTAVRVLGVNNQPFG
jgi:hypothetical protein